MTVDLEKNYFLKPGDGLLWVKDLAPKSEERGAQIYHAMKRKDKKWKLEFANNVTLNQKELGSLVYINHDPALNQEVKASVVEREKKKTIAVSIEVEITLGQPLVARMGDGSQMVEVKTYSPVQLAKTKGATDESIQEELGSLGGTVFNLMDIKVTRHTTEAVFIPNKDLKELRRHLCEKLEDLRIFQTVDHFHTEIKSADETLIWFDKEKTENPDKNKTLDQLRLRVLLRDREQVLDFAAALDLGKIETAKIDYVFLDFEFGRDFADSLELLRSKKVKVAIATTRILKPGEYNNLKAIQRMNPDGILVRNLGALQYFTKTSVFTGDLFGDFSLNVTNHLSAKYLLNKGLKSLCLSYDLNRAQVEDLLSASDGQKLEVTAHQYMPSFHMEHCVFAAFLSQGRSFVDCGKPCEKHQLELKDQFGNFHQIKADHECRNTMFNAIPYSAVRMVSGWSDLGLGYIRYEALKEKGEELISKISAYQNFLSGKLSAEDVVSSLRLVEKYGLGEGALGRQT
jgi:putative protease